jgi:hypothetical protein
MIIPSVTILSTACSDELQATMDSSYIRRLLYECNAPASVAVALRATNPSGFGTYLERRPEGDVNREPDNTALYSRLMLLGRYVDKGQLSMGLRRT